MYAARHRRYLATILIAAISSLYITQALADFYSWKPAVASGGSDAGADDTANERSSITIDRLWIFEHVRHSLPDSVEDLHGYYGLRHDHRILI